MNTFIRSRTQLRPKTDPQDEFCPPEAFQAMTQGPPRYLVMKDDKHYNPADGSGVIYPVRSLFLFGLHVNELDQLGLDRVETLPPNCNWLERHRNQPFDLDEVFSIPTVDAQDNPVTVWFTTQFTNHLWSCKEWHPRLGSPVLRVDVIVRNVVSEMRSRATYCYPIAAYQFMAYDGTGLHWHEVCRHSQTSESEAMGVTIRSQHYCVGPMMLALQNPETFVPSNPQLDTAPVFCLDNEVQPMIVKILINTPIDNKMVRVAKLDGNDPRGMDRVQSNALDILIHDATARAPPAAQPIVLDDDSIESIS